MSLVLITMGIFWFVGVPYVLHRRNEREKFAETFGDYLEHSRLSQLRPLSRNVLLGISAALIIRKGRVRKMQRIILLLLVVMVFYLSGCNSDSLCQLDQMKLMRNT